MAVTPLFFSSNLVFGRSVIDEVAPFTLAFLRWTIVALALSPFVLREWPAVRRTVGRSALRILVFGFLGMWVCGAIVYVALSSTTATNGTLIYTTSPVIIIVTEAIFKGRRIGLREALGSAIAFIGVAVIVLKGNPAALFALDFNPGDLLFVFAATCWACYSILYRAEALRALSNLCLFSIVAAAGALLIAPFALAEWLSGQAMPATATAWRDIAGIVVFASLLAFSGFQYGTRTLGASVAGVFMYLLPPYGVFLAVTFLGEAFLSYHAAGIALVMGGIILATFPLARLMGRRARNQPSEARPGKVSSSQ